MQALLCVFALAAAVALAQHEYGGPVSFDTPFAASADELVSVTFRGTNLSVGTMFFLGGNLSACHQGTVFALPLPSTADGQPKPLGGAISTRILSWTRHDPSTFFVAHFTVRTATTHAYACYSRDGGRHWHAATNARGRPYFRIWHRPPTAEVAPLTPVLGQPLYVRVTSVPPLRHSARAALVLRPDGCDGDTPHAVALGGNATTNHDAASENVATFVFTPRQGSTHAETAAQEVFLCVSSAADGHGDWSLVPFDLADDPALALTVGSDYGAAGRQREWRGNEPRHLPGAAPADVGLTLAAPASKHATATVACHPLIQNIESVCTVTLVNKSTLIGLNATDFAVTQLTDGGGTPECPLPPVATDTGAATGDAFVFKWTPQRPGRGGTVRMTYQGRPVIFQENAASYAFFHNLPNGTRQRLPSARTDHATSHFIVAPGTPHRHAYGETSLVQGLGHFRNAPTAAAIAAGNVGVAAELSRSWRIRRGDANATNVTVHHEPESISLRAGVSAAVATIVVPIPTDSTVCRFRAPYLFSPDNGVDLTTTSYIGSVRLVALSQGTRRDVRVLSRFELYAHGTRVVVTGGPRVGGMDGDANAWEAVGAEHGVAVGTLQAADEAAATEPQRAENSYGALRVELEAYGGLQPTLHFGVPELRCSSLVRTPPAEVRALRRLHAALVAAPAAAAGPAAASSLQDTATRGAEAPLPLRWARNGTFLGDPCVDHWRGVTCRNLHVVGLDLSHTGLIGELPPLAELAWLERLEMRGNGLSGALPAHLRNLTRLQYVDLSDNGLSHVPDALFSPATHRCLHVVRLRGNRLGAFPRQLSNSPALALLDLSHNSLVGRVPDFSPAVPLRHVDLSHNFLSGPLPMLPFASVESLDLSVNRFNGTLPAAWAALQRAVFVDVSKNHLTGPIPLALSQIRSATRLTFRAEENFLDGLLPNLGFAHVDVRDNVFHCPLPLQLPFVLTSHVHGVDSMACDFAPH